MATAPPRPDALLLERLRERDRTAWEEVYRLYEGRLYGFAYRLTGNPHDAADLVQETFVRALPKLDRLPPERADVGAYLFATTKNLFLKGVERSKRQQPVDEVPEPDEPGAIEDDPQRSALLRRQQEEVRLANARLAPRQRLVLALRELEDRSYAEIGELVGLNENAVAQLISRARQSLREELRLFQVDRSRLSKECQSYLPLLSAHLDGQLRGPKLDRTLAHLDGCAACQAVVADMREASRRYRAVVPPLVGLVALKDRIGDALGASGYWDGPVAGSSVRAWAAGRPKLFLVGAAAAGAVALGGLGGGLAYVSTHDADPAPVPAAAGATVEAAASASTGSAETPPAGAEPAEAGTAPAAAAEAVATVTGETAGGGTQTAPETAAATDGATEDATVAAAEGETQADPVTTPEDAPDRVAPTVFVLSGPPSPTEATSATFRVRSSEKAALRCRLDAGGYRPCSSPVRYRGLAPGPHTFAALAVDAAGNVGSAASYTWTIRPPAATSAPSPPPAEGSEPEAPAGDTTAPSVTISGQPGATTTETTATFAFSASEPATFRCRLDGGAPAPCQSPHAYAGLDTGAHSFTVEALDDAGNVGSASYSWTIVPAPLPDLAVSSLTGSTVTVTNAGSAAAGSFTVGVSGGITFTFAGLAPGASATRTFASACNGGTITATVDADGQVAESDEGNNSRSIPC